MRNQHSSNLSLVERVERLEKKVVGEGRLNERISNCGKYYFQTYWERSQFGDIGICYLDQDPHYEIMYSVYKDKHSGKWIYSCSDSEGLEDKLKFSSFSLAVEKFIAVTRIKDPLVFFFNIGKFKRFSNSYPVE